MLVVFQNAIIYNPFLPPNARSMRIADFARDCGGIQWREERIRSMDGTSIALCVAQVFTGEKQARGGPVIPVYILYFQGNASSLPPRLPDLSWTLRRLPETEERVSYTMVCVSYRGFWTSHDRPSENGIDQDCEAALQWVSQLHKTRSANEELRRPVVILWGQSIGCGFATNLAARHGDSSAGIGIDALVLETPFTSTRAMLKALYPQRWLPYQYLWPFLRTHLDSSRNLGIISSKTVATRPPEIYIVEAGQDELVPADHSAILQQRCLDAGLPVVRHTIRKALHNEVMVRPAGKHAIAQSISSAVAQASRPGLRHQQGP